MRLLLILFTPTSESLESLTSSCCVYSAKSFLFLASPSANRSISQQRGSQSQSWTILGFYLIQPLLKAERTVKRGQVTQGSWSRSWTDLGLANPQPLWTVWAIAWPLPCEYWAPIIQSVFPVCSWHLLPITLFLCAPDKNAAPSSLYLPIIQLSTAATALLFSKLNTHFSQHLSSFSHSVCSRTFFISAAFWEAHFKYVSVFFFAVGSPGFDTVLLTCSQFLNRGE